MSELLLTADCGNTSCKLRLWDPAELARPFDGADLPSDGRLGERARAWLDATPRAPRAAAISSVGPGGAADSLRDALAALDVALVDAPDTGLENRCRVPERVGRDRLYAARGALLRSPADAVVVDAGTALTVAAGGAFLGGSIGAGARLAAEALARGTANLPLVEPAPGARALGRDSEEAILAGVVVGLRGAAAELVRGVAREAGFASPTVVVTGGARALLLEPEPCLTPFHEGGLVVEPELVALGLLAAAFPGSLGS